jgi:hypothetical protein
MFHFSSARDVIWLVVSLSGAAATAHLVIERMFGSPMFSMFVKVIPRLMTTLYPYEPAFSWFEQKTNAESIEEAGDVCLVFLVALLAVVFLMLGFWVVLVMRLASKWHVPTPVLLIWFFALFVGNVVSAANQTAITFKMIPPPVKTVNGVRNRMLRDPLATAKVAMKYFAQDWVLPIFHSLKLLLTVILVIVLYWPAWVIHATQRNHRLDLAKSDVRTLYFGTYSLFCVVAAVLLRFLPSP